MSETWVGMTTTVPLGLPRPSKHSSVSAAARWEFSRWGFSDFTVNQSGLGSGRPRAGEKPFKKLGGFAPHLLKSFPGRPGPPRPPNDRFLKQITRPPSAKPPSGSRRRCWAVFGYTGVCRFVGGPPGHPPGAQEKQSNDKFSFIESYEGRSGPKVTALADCAKRIERSDLGRTSDRRRPGLRRF